MMKIIIKNHLPLVNPRRKDTDKCTYAARFDGDDPRYRKTKHYSGYGISEEDAIRDLYEVFADNKFPTPEVECVEQYIPPMPRSIN